MAKFLFVVQGEGRGHMTQAISMYHLLTANGHEVCSVMVGCSNNREIPRFFYDKIAAPVIPFASPNFVVDGRNKSIKFYTRLTAYGASKRLALSFYELPSHKRVRVIPPLLRKEVYSARVSEGDYFLVYLVNSGYSEEIIRWNEKNPRQELHCFWDKKDAPEEFRHSPTLTFHRLSDQKFLKLMAACKAFISTAGFESICESMYFGKPVFLVPVEGHFEQLCNAIDAQVAGAGIYDTTFSIDKLMHYLPDHIPSDNFRNWANMLPNRFLGEIQAVTERSGTDAAYANTN
ncbi:MAG TPA: hypothetical protein DIW47_15245 [Bacteroidetes bacterium]|nr:hypothetical protein [Bacteroidota bacterium]